MSNQQAFKPRKISWNPQKFYKKSSITSFYIAKLSSRGTLRFRVEGEKHTSRTKSDQYSGLSVGNFVNKMELNRCFVLSVIIAVVD